MKQKNHSNLLAALLCAGSLVIAPAYGQESGNSGDWQYSANIYLWGAGVGATTQGGAEIDVSFSDIVSALDFALMGGVEARRDRWLLVGDAIYLKIQEDDGGFIPGPGGGATVAANVTTKSKVLNLAGGYSLVNNENGTLYGIFGARYLDLDNRLTVAVGGPGPGAVRGITASGSGWDGIIGIRGNINLNDRWYLPYHLDVGAGESDSTWQAVGGVGYKYGWGDVVFAYRHIDWDLGSDRVIDEIDFSGPALQAKWYF